MKWQSQEEQQEQGKDNKPVVIVAGILGTPRVPVDDRKFFWDLRMALDSEWESFIAAATTSGLTDAFQNV